MIEIPYSRIVAVPHWNFHARDRRNDDEQGSLTVPIEVRRTLGLKRGDKVVFHLEGGDVRLAPATSRLAAGFHSIPALVPAKTWQEIEAIVEDERAVATFRDEAAAG